MMILMFKEGKCKFNPKNVVANCTGFIDIKSGDEDALKEAVASVGPVSIAIDVTEDKFMLYKDGVFVDNTCSNGQDDLNHGVLVVGYGSDDSIASGKRKEGLEFWIGNNSILCYQKCNCYYLTNLFFYPIQLRTRGVLNGERKATFEWPETRTTCAVSQPAPRTHLSRTTLF